MRVGPKDRSIQHRHALWYLCSWI